MHPVFRVCLSIEVNIERQLGLSELSVILWVSAVEGVIVNWDITVDNGERKETALFHRCI